MQILVPHLARTLPLLHFRGVRVLDYFLMGCCGQRSETPTHVLRIFLPKLSADLIALCYNDGLVLHNLILVIILMLYIVFYPTRTCGRTMSVNIEHVLPCINKIK